MNLLLIITTAFVVYWRTSNAFDVKHHLLILPNDADLVEESYTPGHWSYNITSEKPIQVESISDTNLVGLNLTAPFIVTAIFKSYNGKPSCLFSITQDDLVVMSLCIEPAAENISRIYLNTGLYSPENSIYGLMNENFREKWFKIVVYVRDDKADIYVNCSKLSDTMILMKDKDVLLSKDMKLNLAISKKYKFEGLIEDISLYTNADDTTLQFQCNKLRDDFVTWEADGPQTGGTPDQPELPERSVQHKLLIVPDDVDTVDESYTTGRMSYKFTRGEPVQVNINDTNLVGLNLTAPFIVTAIFKSYNGKSSNLFSITQDDRIVMRLGIQPAGHDVSRIALLTELYSPEESIYAFINENYKEKWFKIVVYVRDDKADIYVNCSQLPDTMILSKNKDVLLSKDVQLYLGYKFRGLIEEISLYTNANEDTLRYECNKIHTTFNTEVFSSKTPNEINPQPQEYDRKNYLAEFTREITSIKKGMLAQVENIKEGLHEKNENMTMLMRNEIREDIDQLLNINEYLVHELKTIKEKIIELENQQKSIIFSIESQQKLSNNTEPTYKQKES